jgi:hypothetical protein
MFSLKEYKLFQEKIRNLLSIDGETLFPFVKCSHLLLVAKTILIDLNQYLQNIPVYIKILKYNLIFFK